MVAGHCVDSDAGHGEAEFVRPDAPADDAHPGPVQRFDEGGVRLGRRQETDAGAAQGMQAGDDLFRGRKSAEAACEIGEQQPRQLREDVCGRANGFLIERAQREPLAVAAPGGRGPL